tara:strand:+ start:226 stop:369 length:144 start_codon:yes stop_codon:yes gene_type:complete
MIKKKILLILCLFFLFTCGKKGDPEYKGKIYKFDFEKEQIYLNSKIS